MNDSRFEWKVGIFVFAGLAAAALLILNFTKGITLFQPTIKVDVILPTVAGLKPDSDVMLGGVPIGKVAGTTLREDGRSVDVTVAILAKSKIRANATFHIDVQGILGDQYIEVTPAEAPGASQKSALVLTNGETVIGEAPFNLQEAVRSVSGLLDQGRKTMTDLDQAITNVNRSILAGETLTNFGLALSNFEALTANAAGMAVQLRGLLDSNLPPIHVAVTNFVALSDKLNLAADQLGQTISTNSGEVTAAVKNFRELSEELKELADGLQAGQGVAGSLLKDDKMKAELGAMLTNANGMAEQFNLFGLHLNENGIWRTLWKPKTPATNTAPH